MRLIVTGTDTDVGKTVFCAALAGAADAYYWKPLQAGLDGATDSATVANLSGLGPSRIIPEAWRLKHALSPHRAAELDCVEIDIASLRVPGVERLVIEGAGGALVPVNRGTLMADLFAQWGLPLVVVARTSLGTINHSLMTIECLRARGLAIQGIAFVGDANADSERTICEMAGVKRLGRLPLLDRLERNGLSAAFSANFRVEDFQ